jgi:hypothetical protein
VFLVRREAVLAAPNAVPNGATAPAGTVFVLLEIVLTGAVVSLRCVDPDLGLLAVALGPDAQAVKDAICQVLGSLPTLDLTAPLQQLGMPAVKSVRIELVGNVVAIRFEPAGNAVAHLFPGQEWGLFLDGASVEQLAISKVPPDLKSRITSLTLNPHWRPVGNTPHVDVDYAGNAVVPDPFSGTVDGTFRCDFSLAPPPLRGLRTTVHWSLHVHLDGIVGILDDLVTDSVAGAMDPVKFGGTPIGDHAFTIDNPLPDLSFGGARFGYSSVVASPAGMTVGGVVRLPLDPGRDTVNPLVHEFGLPVRLTFCRTLAKSGSGEPGKTVLLNEVTTSGSVWLENLGAFCGVEIVSPGDWIKEHVKLPADTPEIRFVIPSLAALGIVEHVRLIVRTGRGVRLIDLGTPPPVILDANGNVTNALASHIPNCLYIDVEHGIKWARAGGLLDESVVKPPPEHPDWTAYLGRHRGIEVQLVTLSMLEPGELIQFRSHDHAVDVTANRNGQALVPVLLQVAKNPEQASLIRVNRHAIAGHFTIHAAIFVNQASLPVGTKYRLASSGKGMALLTTEFEDHIEVHEIGPLGVPMLLQRETACTQESRGPAQREMTHLSATVGKNLVQHESHNAIRSQTRPSNEEIALNPQPLPPRDVVKPADNLLLAPRINLPGIASVVAVPGFPGAPIALAAMVDGSMLVLDLGEDGTARVAGTFSGPIGVLDESGDWAVATNTDRISIYRVTRDLG